MFSSDELERYKRHILLREVGGSGQQWLKEANVLIVGAGGLASPLLSYLAAAGVGTIGIIDDDTVDISNLQRQVIYKETDIGSPKVLAAKCNIENLNSNINIVTYKERLTLDNANSIITSYDVIADACDNFSTRYLVSDICYKAKKTLVSGAVGHFDGHLTVFKPFIDDLKGNPNPTYRCLYPENTINNNSGECSEYGIIGALTGIIGSLQAMEVLKEILEIGDSLVGKLIIYDALSTTFKTIKYRWDPNNPINGRVEL